VRSILSLMTVLLVTTTAAMPQDQEEEVERKTLRGLSGVWVLVSELAPEATADGLSKTAIQTDVEVKLRQAGIKVLAESQVAATPGQPLLHVMVTALRRVDVFYAVDVQVELRQSVRLLRDPSVVVPLATTWRSRGWLGTVGREKLQTVRDDIKDNVDQRGTFCWLQVPATCIKG
jgi:hypothetical protein